jgi:murein DD-endopeptidase MepM/ murein hydrolase activator NlpD
MRCLVLRHRFRLLSRVAVAALVTGFAAGCSSDFSRFDAGLQAGNVNQAAAPNPYPGVDQTVTASVGNNAGPVPMQNVNANLGEPDHQGYDPNLAQANGQAYQQSYGPPYANGQGQAYAQANNGGIQRTELPKMDEQRSARAAQDQVRTGSVAAKQSAGVQEKQKGWSRTGGTTITLREGETLYNLSRRYGVPVKSIMQANDIANADHVRVGQQIIIPSYTYGEGVGVSAPDNDARTQRASAARGEQLAAGKTPVPEQQAVRKVRTVSVEKTGKTVDSIDDGKIERRQEIAADRSGQGIDPIVTGGAAGKSAAGKDDSVEGKLDAKSNENAPEGSGIGVFRWPVRGRIVSNFGDATASGKNDGIDISVPEGTAVKAVENGVVVYAGNELQGLGNLVLVQHSDGWVSAYAHNRDIEVKRGDKVRRGEILARSGRSGNADTPKLHFELRRYSKPVDPVRFLDGA